MEAGHCASGRLHERSGVRELYTRAISGLRGEGKPACGIEEVVEGDER